MGSKVKKEELKYKKAKKEEKAGAAEVRER